MLVRMIIILLVGFWLTALPQTTHAQRKKDSQSPARKLSSEEQLLKAETTLIEAQKQLILENYAKAYELFLLARELNPDNAAIYFKLGEVLVKSGENEKGLIQIEDAIRRDNSNKYYHIFKAEILKAVSRYDEAIKAYETLIETIPGNEGYFIDIGTLYQHTGKWDKALAAYNNAEEVLGLSEMILAEKQNIYLRKNDMKGLLAEWEKYLEQFPDEPGLLLELSSLLVANDMTSDATKKLNLFNERFPDNPSGDLLLSELARKEGDFGKAIRLLKRPVASTQVELISKIQILNNFLSVAQQGTHQQDFADLLETLISVHPESFEAMAFTGDFYMQSGSINDALDYYLRATHLSKSNYNIWQNIVNLEWQEQMFDSLIRHTDQALEYFPNQAIFYFYNGTAHYIQENYKKATQVLELGKNYTNDPNLLSVFFGQLGDAYNSLKDYTKSDQSYLKALEFDPNNDHVLNNFSYFLSLRKTKLDDALKMSGRLVKQYPDNPTYLDTHGWVLYILGKYPEAKEYLYRAIQLDNDGTVLEHYGDVLFQLGETEEAIVYWEKAKAAGGTTDLIDKKLADKKLYE